jgi:hypothetical protein
MASGIAPAEDVLAHQVVNDLRLVYGLNLLVDWGPGENAWQPGRWVLAELELVRHAMVLLANAFGDAQRLQTQLGALEITKTPTACGRGCTHGRFLWRKAFIELKDTNLSPQPGSDVTRMVEDGSINFDLWTVIHELAHAWDANHNWQLSRRLEQYSGGYTNWVKGWLIRRQGGCTDNALPGCNTAGYFYGGVPPKGSDGHFTRAEDFAESVTASIFPLVAQSKIAHYQGKQLEALLFYPDYAATPRRAFVDGLFRGI